jgi:hypothetical protein
MEATQMKTRMVVAMVLLFVTAHTLPAQEPGWMFEANGMLAQPSLGLSHDWSAGLGGNAVVSYVANSRFAATLRAGCILFPGKAVAFPSGLTLTPPDYKIVPILLGGRYFVLRGDFQVFLGLEGGMYHQTHSSSLSAFGLDPNLGFRIRVTDGMDLGIEAKYEVVFTTTTIEWSSSSTSAQMRQDINGGFAYSGLIVGLAFH